MAKKSSDILPAKQHELSPIVVKPRQRPDPTLFTAILVDTEEKRAAMWAALYAAALVAVDTETTGLLVDRDKIIGICFSVPPWGIGWYMPLYNSPDGTFWYADETEFPIVVQQIRDFLESDIPKIFHNMLFDVPMLYCNFEMATRKIIGDTMLLSHVNDPDNEHGLKENAVKRIHPEADWYEVELHRWNKAVGGSAENPKYWLIPAPVVATYGAGDAVFTGRLWDILHQKLLPQLNDVFECITMPLTHAILEMRTDGVFLDKEYLERGKTWTHYRCLEIEKDIRGAVGNPTLNISSPDQLRRLLYTILELPTGKHGKKGFSTDKFELERLEGTHPVVDMILAYRKEEKLNSTYFEGLLSVIGPDGMFRPDVKVHGTRTGRISMSRLHQIPRGPLVRNAVIAEPDYVLCGGDANQLEARVLTHYSQDPALIDVYSNDRDVHSATAKYMFSLPCEIEEVKTLFPDMRDRAKSINFALLYLESVYGLKKQLKCSLDEAKSYYAGFFEVYSTIPAWADTIVQSVRYSGYVEMLLGRRRYIPELGHAPPHKAPLYPKVRKPCYAKNRRKGGIGLSLQYDLSMDCADWTMEKADLIRPLLANAKKGECAECPDLWGCYYTTEYYRVRAEIEHYQRTAVNSLIQGSGADLMNLGIVRTNELIQKHSYDARLKIYVHDEVVYQIPKDSNVELFKKDFQKSMESVSEFLSVPMKFETKAIAIWSQLK